MQPRHRNKQKAMLKLKNLSVILILFLAAVLPITVFLVQQQTNFGGKAAGPPTTMHLVGGSLFKVGEEFDVVVFLDTNPDNNPGGDVMVDAVDVVLKYDPEKVEVIGNVIPGTIFQKYCGTNCNDISSAVDATSGRIVLSALAWDDTNNTPLSPYSNLNNTAGEVAKIHFKALAQDPATIISFEFTEGLTTDSNVVAHGTGEDSLVRAQNLAFAIKAPLNIIGDQPSFNFDSNTSISFNWETDEASDSLVELGLSNSLHNAITNQDQTDATSHAVTLSNLRECSTYYYRVRSRDTNNHEATSSATSLTTPGCVGNADIIVQTDDNFEPDTQKTISLNQNSIDLVSLDIPATLATLSAEVINFQLKKLEKDAALAAIVDTPQDYSLVGDHLYDLKALNSVSTRLSSFDNPLTIKINYQQNEVGDLDENSFSIFRWNGSTWNQLTDCDSVDRSARNLNCRASQFSIFGLFGQLPAPTATPTLTPTAGPTATSAPAPTSPPNNDNNNNNNDNNNNDNNNNDNNNNDNNNNAGNRGRGDLNNDGKVNVFDLSMLLRKWNHGSNVGDVDINGDGKVNVFDLSIMLRNWTR